MVSLPILERQGADAGRLPGSLVPFAVFSAISFALCALYFTTGTGVLDFNGHALGRDFLNYWTAGQLVGDGRGLDIFDRIEFLTVERELVHPDLPHHFWSYPPPALFLVAPLQFFGYFPGLVVWTLAGFAALLPVARTLFDDTHSRWLFLLAPAVAVNVALGQNGAFTAALLLGGLLLLDKRPVLAGILFGLLIFKPHLGLLLPVAVIAERRWTTFGAAAATVAAILALSVLVFGVETWQAFFDKTLPLQLKMMSLGGGQFLLMMTTAFASGRILGLGGEASFIQLPFFLLAAVLVWRGCRSDRTLREKACLVALATFVATPQAFNYDLIPAAAAVLLIAERDISALWARLVWILPLFVIALGLLKLPVAPLLLTWALWEFMKATEPAAQSR